jgi:hypothetical protein
MNYEERTNPEQTRPGRRHKSPTAAKRVDVAQLLPREDDSRRREQHSRRKADDQNGRHTRDRADTHSPDHVEPARDLGQPAVDASEKYGRRKRHKTREERYEYNAQHTTADAKRESRAKEKRKSHRKTGSTLHKDFKAPNVGSERLTLKQDALPGIFSKGKASGPIERRGIPDLTFSEMSFLNNKRQLDHAKLRGVQALGQSGNKKGGAEDISGYFGEPAAGDHVQDRTHPTGSPGPPLDCHTSPGRPPRLHSDDLVQQQRAISDRAPKERLPQVHVFEDGAWYQRDRNLSEHIDDTQLSSHVSWSTSPSRRPTALKPHSRISLRRQIANAPSSFVEQASHAQVASVHPRSSASQSYQHLSNYGNITKDRDAGPGDTEGADTKRQYYTLEDLMLLADRRQAEFEDQRLPLLRDDDRDLMNLLEGLPRPPSIHIPRAQFNLRHLGLEGPDPDMMPRYDDEIQLGLAPDQFLRESTPSAPQRSYREQRDSPTRAGVISKREILELEALYERSEAGTHLDNFDLGLLEPAQEHQARDQAHPSDYQFEPDEYTRSVRRSQDDAEPGSARPQLLRPSCEASSIMSPFKPFSRPRLLY